MDILKTALYPFACLYDGITRFRNHLYEIGYKKSFQFEVATISVGNLSAGGTGKTPMIEYLIRLVSRDFKVATLSRGYGRKTTGFHLATEADSAKTLGDEPYQFYLKFGKDITVAVGEERAPAIPEILFEAPETEVVLLDDAFQHRSVVPHVNLLLTEYDHPFYEDYVLPAGRLREARKGAQRATAILVTKCPSELDPGNREKIKKHIGRYARPGTPVFFTTVRYEPVLPVSHPATTIPGKDVVLFTGIANPGPLVRHMENHYNIIKHIRYPDHYTYKPEDIKRLQRELTGAGDQVSLLTTEKDMVRLLHPDLETLIAPLPLFYLPITVTFLEGQALFDTMVIRAIREAKGAN